MKFSIKDLFGKCDQIHSKIRICSQLLKKSLVENFIFCAKNITKYRSQSIHLQVIWLFLYTGNINLK